MTKIQEIFKTIFVVNFFNNVNIDWEFTARGTTRTILKTTNETSKGVVLTYNIFSSLNVHFIRAYWLNYLFECLGDLTDATDHILMVKRLESIALDNWRMSQMSWDNGFTKTLKFLKTRAFFGYEAIIYRMFISIIKLKSTFFS